VQRLIHQPQSNVVKVPQSSYDLTVNWDEAKRVQDDDAPSRRVGEIITGAVAGSPSSAQASEVAAAPSESVGSQGAEVAASADDEVATRANAVAGVPEPPRRELKSRAAARTRRRTKTEPKPGA
jgi:hypothetical protein